MKILTTEFGQVTWIVDISLPSGTLYLPEAISKLTQRYGFVHAPTAEDVLSEEPGYQFQHGKFRNSVIRKFSLHTDGLVAESQAGTHVAEAFLNDFMGWITDEFQATTLDINDQYKLYDSHLVVRLNSHVMDKMEFASFIAESINKEMAAYVNRAPTYYPAGFQLAPDNAGTNAIPTSSFRLERRQGQEFRKNVFFSTAPLKTEEHQRLLEKIESAI